nr:8491_t:CDS:2 [Entrophospora candida]
MSTHLSNVPIQPHQQLFSNSLQPNVSPLGQQSQNQTMLLQPPLPSIITTNNTNNTNNTHIQPIISSTNSGNSIFSNNNTGRQNIPSSTLSPSPRQSNTTINLPHNILANLDHSALSPRVEDAARTLFLSSRLNGDFSSLKDNNDNDNKNKLQVTSTSLLHDHSLHHDSLDIDETPSIYSEHNQQQEQLKHGGKDYTDEEIIERQGEIGLIPYNRGHKLKNRADLIDEKSRLKAPYDIYQDIEYIDTPNNQRCPIIHRFPRNSILKAVEYYDDTEFNPYKDINVGEILGPLVKLEDVIKKPHYKRILNDNSLTHCADFLMERIETEKNFNNIISRLMTVLQGDDAMYPNLDFRLNPSPEIVSTRVVKAGEEEGGMGLGVLNVGLQGNDRNKDIRIHEAKDQGLETLIAVREQLQEQISNSNEVLRCLIESRNGVLRSIRQRDLLKIKIISIDKHKKKLEKKESKRNYQEALE